MHASFGPRRLNRLAVILLVLAREVFKTPKVVPAIEHAESCGIDLGNGDMEMRTAVFDVPDDETRAVCPNIEFGIDGFQEGGKLRGRHFPFRRNRPMPHGITAAFHRRERMSIMERASVAGQNLNAFVFARFVEQMTGEIVDATLTGDAGCLDDHATISRTRVRTASMPASVAARSASCPASFPAFARRTS
nr:hypothetical protein [Rhizobium laguerreae]